MKIAIGADHAGYRLKDVIIPFIESLGHQVVDFGCSCADSVDYPDYALKVCEKVVSGEADKGILICGTGIGMSIAANKVPGIRCALVHDLFSAKATREHNDTNVLALGRTSNWTGCSRGNRENLARNRVFRKVFVTRIGLTKYKVSKTVSHCIHSIFPYGKFPETRDHDDRFHLSNVAEALETNLRELVKVGNLRSGHILIIGTSTSEILGHRIGTSGTLDAAKPIFETAAAHMRASSGCTSAFQCCEHLNRAIVIEEELLAHTPQLEPVSVIPVPKAGGSMASYAYRHFAKPVVVETIQAHAGIDIGSTLIGMHLRPVAVPARPPVRNIGHAYVTMAFTRPKLIGGTRAVYYLMKRNNSIKQLHPMRIVSHYLIELRLNK